MTAPVLLMTRAQTQSDRFIAELGARVEGLQAIVSPLLRIAFRDVPLPEGARIFTSENGVRAHARLAPGAGRVAWCVGDRTAAAAQAAGFEARSADGNAEALLALLLHERPAGPLVHIRGTHGHGDLAERLNSAGIETQEVILYDQVAEPLNSAARAALLADAPVYVPLFSPRTAALFSQGAAAAMAPLHLVALSSAVAAALKDCPRVSLTVAARPDAAALAAALALRIAAGPAA